MSSDQNQEPTEGGGPTASAQGTETVEQVLAAQRELLEQLRLHTDELDALTERECGLEVELIAAEAACKTSILKDIPGLDEAKAGVIAETLAREGSLPGGPPEAPIPPNRPPGKVTKRELAKLRGAHEALNAWLDAPTEVKRRELSPITQALLGLALLATIWAGFTFHLAFLLLLIPLGMPFSFLALGAHDLSWVRLGMRRRFEGTGLDPPATWKPTEVRARLSEIERSLRLARTQPESDADPEAAMTPERPSQEAQRAQTESRLHQIMAEAGLDTAGIGEELARWLELEAAVRRTRRELRAVQAKRRAIGKETDAGREELYRFLSRRGESPPRGRADLDALAAGLERLGQKPSEC